MQELHKASWRNFADQLETLCDNIYVVRNCDQSLFSRQQINFNFDTVSSLLSLIYANLKSFWAAFFAYHINMLNSIPARLRNYVRMSFLNSASFHQVFEQVAHIQFYATDRLTLAILFDNFLSYYEAQLLQDVFTLLEFLLTLLWPHAQLSWPFMKLFRCRVQLSKPPMSCVSVVLLSQWFYMFLWYI